MTDRFHRYLTPVLALGLGAALGRAGWQDQGEALAGDASVLPADHAPAAMSKSVSSRGYRLAEQRRTEMSPESAAFSSAWNSLKSGRHSRDQRYQLQIDLVEKWSAIDAESATLAVLADVPDPEMSETLLTFCVFALGKDPDDVLPKFEKEPFGVDTGLIRRRWLSKRAAREPVEALGLLDHLLPLDRRFVLERVAANLSWAEEEHGGREAVWNRLLELHGGSEWESDVWMIAEAIGGASLTGIRNESRDQLLEATDPATVDLRAAVKARQFVVFEFTEAQVMERLPVLPAEIRDAVLEKWKLHRKPEP